MGLTGVAPERARHARRRASRLAPLPAAGTPAAYSWAAERVVLEPVPTVHEAFDCVVVRRVSRDRLVNCEGRRYSVPFAWVGRPVKVRGTAWHVVVLGEGRVLVRHAGQTAERLVPEPAHYDGAASAAVWVGQRAHFQLATQLATQLAGVPVLPAPQLPAARVRRAPRDRPPRPGRCLPPLSSTGCGNLPVHGPREFGCACTDVQEAPKVVPHLELVLGHRVHDAPRLALGVEACRTRSVRECGVPRDLCRPVGTREGRCGRRSPLLPLRRREPARPPYGFMSHCCLRQATASCHARTVKHMDLAMATCRLGNISTCKLSSAAQAPVRYVGSRGRAYSALQAITAGHTFGHALVTFAPVTGCTG